MDVLEGDTQGFLSCEIGFGEQAAIGLTLMRNFEETRHDLLRCDSLYRSDDTLDHVGAVISRLVPHLQSGRGDQSVNDVSI
jgi:hypothetical protein